MPRNQEAEEEEFSERNCNCTFFLLRENKAMICVCVVSVVSTTHQNALQMYVSSHHRFTSIFRIIQENTLPFLSISCIYSTTTTATHLTIKPQLELFWPSLPLKNSIPCFAPCIWIFIAEIKETFVRSGSCYITYYKYLVHKGVMVIGFFVLL